MFLSDQDIRALLREINFDTGDPNKPFCPDEQIQPASVDLRLDSVFWRQRSTSTIDLRRSKLLEISPRRHWSKLMLERGESIALKPGEMVLGRTFEVFSVPNGYAGRLEGRSSFGRMGLAVHCTAGYMNPGWRGRMPLELVNLSRSPIRLFALLPICQVMFVRLSSPAQLPYGARELSSKYLDDDGGPSYWWRDKRIKDLQAALGEHDVTERMQNELLQLMSTRDPDLVERFEKMVRQLRAGELTNAEDILQKFARSEDWQRIRAQVGKGLMTGLFPVLVATSLGSLFSQPFGWTHYGWLHYGLWAVTLASLPVSIFGLKREIGEYFGTKELHEVQAASI